MKVFRVEYTYFDDKATVMEKDFRYDDQQPEAEKFCADVKENGGSVNIRIKETAE